MILRGMQGEFSLIARHGESLRDDARFSKPDGIDEAFRALTTKGCICPTSREAGRPVPLPLHSDPEATPKNRRIDLWHADPFAASVVDTGPMPA